MSARLFLNTQRATAALQEQTGSPDGQAPRRAFASLLSSTLGAAPAAPMAHGAAGSSESTSDKSMPRPHAALLNTPGALRQGQHAENQAGFAATGEPAEKASDTDQAASLALPPEPPTMPPDTAVSTDSSPTPQGNSVQSAADSDEDKSSANHGASALGSLAASPQNKSDSANPSSKTQPTTPPAHDTASSAKGAKKSSSAATSLSGQTGSQTTQDQGNPKAEQRLPSEAAPPSEKHQPTETHSSRAKATSDAPRETPPLTSSAKKENGFAASERGESSEKAPAAKYTAEKSERSSSPAKLSPASKNDGPVKPKVSAALENRSGETESKRRPGEVNRSSSQPADKSAAPNASSPRPSRAPESTTPPPKERPSPSSQIKSATASDSQASDSPSTDAKPAKENASPARAQAPSAEPSARRSKGPTPSPHATQTPSAAQSPSMDFSSSQDFSSGNFSGQGDDSSQATSPESASSTSSSSEKASRAASAQGARRSLSAAWMRAAVSRTLRSGTLKNGWNVMEMKLNDGDGTMTVRTRQDGDRMAVTVGFSDAGLRSQAAAQAPQLQDALQNQYETAVDFSLMGDGDGSFQDETSQRAADGSMARPGDGAENTEEAEDGPSARARSAGATREWVG